MPDPDAIAKVASHTDKAVSELRQAVLKCPTDLTDQSIRERLSRALSDVEDIASDISAHR